MKTRETQAATLDEGLIGIRLQEESFFLLTVYTIIIKKRHGIQASSLWAVTKDLTRFNNKLRISPQIQETGKRGECSVVINTLKEVLSMELVCDPSCLNKCVKKGYPKVSRLRTYRNILALYQSVKCSLGTGYYPVLVSPVSSYLKVNIKSRPHTYTCGFSDFTIFILCL